MFSLKQKVALVTGGGDGIGKAISETLSKQGATVYVLDVNVENGVRTAEKIVDSGYLAYFKQCDVSNQKQVKNVVEDIYDKEGRIDILINNAGIAHIGTALTTSEEDFNRIINVNVKGLYNCVHSCIPFMKKTGGGVIINMASAASVVGLPDRFAYSMSKGAVTTMTYSIARDFVGFNIRCNCISPGRVHTPFVDGYLKEYYPGKETEMFEKLSKTQPIGRMGTPMEIANLVLYLCSDEASFITGSNYPIDGGFVTLNT
ncbi:SDR family oxidoreductase [Chitinophagaceae bacterium LB-8]|uniref:SDR family oxidoreductase n=1 Tax=Paraflavisolibacter caeni TaxID=2982496 RepID=A0A9X3B908_9BACT|nr:SDR family NAD(P)-dependent oxidoreductase [Paraflavisolibacter caeni]MCU7551510.1 SDR family oxidoreductase [Paraflavisolibacter caeni]